MKALNKSVNDGISWIRVLAAAADKRADARLAGNIRASWRPIDIWPRIKVFSTIADPIPVYNKVGSGLNIKIHNPSILSCSFFYQRSNLGRSPVIFEDRIQFFTQMSDTGKIQPGLQAFSTAPEIVFKLKTLFDVNLDTLVSSRLLEIGQYLEIRQCLVLDKI